MAVSGQDIPWTYFFWSLAFTSTSQVCPPLHYWSLLLFSKDFQGLPPKTDMQTPLFRIRGIWMTWCFARPARYQGSHAAGLGSSDRGTPQGVSPISAWFPVSRYSSGALICLRSFEGQQSCRAIWKVIFVCLFVCLQTMEGGWTVLTLPGAEHMLLR